MLLQSSTTEPKTNCDNTGQHQQQPTTPMIDGNPKPKAEVGNKDGGCKHE
jgi:hypothetical protein